MSSSGRRVIGVGIIGAGARGVNCIGRQIAEPFDDTGLRVAALCDRNRERVDAAARLLHNLVPNRGATPPPKTYLDASQLIAAPEVDLVVITTPSYLHREGVTPALRGGETVQMRDIPGHAL
ncbi:MAG: hypothetical protein A3K19_28720 [Lentisphaerae bacterium RIFOXYB12_FULL_65_16]|nr:MAG: hypothetical protein A3K18_01430 [Lentisphaerae bacterium RIFOXYA12_64_32]OGV88263.1 MAG: hypothetical protein A3K19_28720 [Lentisphaerae bacterium RIFOXYB12_FULL_65_16]